MRQALLRFAPLLLLSVAHCSSGSNNLFFNPEDTGTAPTDARTDTGITPIPIRDAGPQARCSEAAQLVYVLSSSNELYSFRPNLRELTRIGPLRCPTTMQPNSMAIDRNAVAWVNYVASSAGFDSAGSIYRVNTATAECTDDPPIALPRGWFRLGMGFSTASADSTDETLFIAATGDLLTGSTGLGRIDPTSLNVVPIGSFTGTLRGQNAELTGTGDGRLFGFFTTTPVRVAQINKATGAIEESTSLPTVETPSSWAFSFWGGDFYLYTAPGALVSGRTSNVTRFRPSDGSVDPRYLTNVGFNIVGAGVSTCAPIAPPP